MGRLKLVLLSVLGAVLVLGAGFASGTLPMSNGSSSRPPCEQLPSKDAVADAVAGSADLQDRLEGVGPGVDVSVATPCPDPGRGIVRVTYASDTERQGVDAVLLQDTFGVALEVVPR